MTRPASPAGWLLEPHSNVRPRGMAVHDRTRLIGRLPTILDSALALRALSSCLLQAATATCTGIATRSCAYSSATACGVLPLAAARCRMELTRERILPTLALTSETSTRA